MFSGEQRSQSRFAQVEALKCQIHYCFISGRQKGALWKGQGTYGGLRQVNDRCIIQNRRKTSEVFYKAKRKTSGFVHYLKVEAVMEMHGNHTKFT